MNGLKQINRTLRGADVDTEQMLMRRYDALAFAQDYAQALASLSEGIQATWILYTEHGFSINDIAQHMNLPYETVKKRIQRAKKCFQEKLRCHCPQMSPY